MYPRLIQYDEGSEFVNKDINPILKRYDIESFSTVSKRKASVVERLNRTIKTKMLKMFIRSKSHRWVDSLSDLIYNYNHTIHSTIKIAPVNVDESNKSLVWNRLFSKKIFPIDTKKTKFYVGDHVRVLAFDVKGQSKSFKKYYREKEGKRKNVHMVEARDKPPFSNEVFTVVQVLIDDPIVYKLFSPQAKVDILGTFYEDELSLVWEEKK